MSVTPRAKWVKQKFFANCWCKLTYFQNLIKQNELSGAIFIYFPYLVIIQVNLAMKDSMGPGKLVRHMQNLFSGYLSVSPSYIRQ